jgi:AcrR family transcriptional regulator
VNPLEARKTSTRSRVLETAKTLFAHKGFSACSMREVAVRAKVNEVTVFRLFGTKQKLYAEVLKEAAECSRLDDLLSGKDVPMFQLQNRKLREVARLFEDSRLLRLLLFGILEQPEVTMKQLHGPLQDLSARLSVRLQAADAGTLPLKQMEALANMMEALALFQQCSSKLVSGKSGRKKPSTKVIGEQIRDAWPVPMLNRKTGTQP